MPSLAELTFANTVESIRLAREAVATAVVGHVSAEDVEVVRLLTSELVSNSYRHGRGPIRLSVVRIGETVSVTVCDDGHGDVRVRPFSVAPGGHGLRLVQEMSAGWEKLGGEGTQVRFWVPAVGERAPRGRIGHTLD